MIMFFVIFGLWYFGVMGIGVDVFFLDGLGVVVVFGRKYGE